MEILSSLGHATFVVQFIVFLLLGMSVYSWGVMSWKAVTLLKLNRSVGSVYSMVAASNGKVSELRSSLGSTPAENIIKNSISLAFGKIAKCQELSDIAHAETLVKDSVGSAVLGLKMHTDRFTSSLATIAMIAPYIGLLGTVWGLLDAFESLSNVKVVTFQTVAPSIVEALFATAIGLFVAIPASVGFNVISGHSTKLSNQLMIINNGIINQMSQSVFSRLLNLKSRHREVSDE